MQIHDEYMQLFQLYAGVVEVTKGIRYNDDQSWKGHPGPIAVKVAMHLATVFYLAEGTRIDRIPSLPLNFIDHASINVVMRAALETFLAFHHLLIAPRTAEERNFRVRIWQIGGLRDRQRFPAIVSENRAKLQKEKVQLDKLIKKIEANPIFQTLTPEERRRARKGDWRLTKQWVDVAVEAGISKQYFEPMYRYLCSYAHSGSLSMLQINEAENKEVQFRLAEPNLGTALIIMSRMVTAFAELFPEARRCLEAAPEHQRYLVRLWHMPADLMDRLYRDKEDAK
jgi:Family of unknown function (DUF5677)